MDARQVLPNNKVQDKHFPPTFGFNVKILKHLTLANKAILHIPITLLPKCIVQMPKSMWAIADHIIDAYTFTILVIFIIETDCFVKSFEIPRP